MRSAGSDAKRVSRAAAAALTLALALTACTGGAEPAARPPGPTTATTAPAQTSSPSPSPSPTATVAAPHPVSLPALMQRRYDGRDFTVGRVLARAGAYTRYAITFESSTLTISGIMNVPAGNGPFPVLILNHGYIDPAVYTTGRGLRREQDYLARRGYVVVHVDYRNHASSDDDQANETNLRIGYVEDVINAVLAIRSSGLPYVNPERIGMLGRSMGGGVTLNAVVVAPGLVRAAVMFAPVSSDAVDNFDRWIRSNDDRRRLAERIAGLYGSPEDNPEFWRNVSARSFLDRIEVPLQIHHGTADESVPYAWTERTVAALKAAGKEVVFHTYPGEAHAFGPQFTTSMQRTVGFLDRYLKG